MLPKIECSDELLLGILNQDSGCSTALGLQHLDNCEHCQTRIEELAANQQQWTLAREGLCSRVEGGLDFGNDFQNPTRFHPTAEHSSEWTDTMAKQLLQPPSHPEMLGRLGRYEIERLVGSGGMGVVFKAYDSELHRSVAIKMLAPYLSGSRSARERFAREARAAAAIVNDHVVPIHNVETEHATPYLVMQYIAGDSLQARLDRDGPLDVCEILRIGMQVAIGLAAAHAQGLIHRDVKPSNIMLDENVARALLTDFGLARTQDEACLTRSGFHPGTPHYMSPEQVRGEELDGRSDLFSLGCVLYALCTGHPPYRADSGYAVMRRITDEQPRSIREQNALIPEWLERVVMRLLEKDREARFQSAEELSQILEQCLAHVQKPATEPLPLAVVPKASFFDRGRIRNWILAGMASAFLFFAGVLIVFETNKGTITIKSEADNVPIRIKRSDQVVYEMVVSRTGKSVRLGAGEYVIEFEGDWQDLVVEGENVSLVRGETKIIQITYRKSDGAEARMSKGTQTRASGAFGTVGVFGAEVPLSNGTQTREIYEKTIEECERLVASAPNNAEYVRDLAVAYSKMGDLFLSEVNHPESRKYYEKALEVFERLVAMKPESAQFSRDLSVTYDKMGDLLRSRGNATLAREYDKKAREIRERLTSISTSAMSESTSTEKDKRVLSAISSLDAPATITVDEELGVVTLKGSREDVARTNRIIEMIREMATKRSQSWFDETPASESATPVKDKRVLSAISRLDVPATIAVDEERGIVTVKGSKADVEKSTRTIEMIRRVADENPSAPIDWSKLNTEVPVVASELAAAVNEFNFNQKNWWAAANYPLLTEDEMCAALWWQANHTKISPELRKEFLAIVLNRKLPTGWSIRLSKIQGEMRERFLQGTTPLQSNSIEINLMHGDQIASTIRSKFVGTNHPSRDQSTSPLADAIANFNKERAGVEPPLTLAETLAAIATLWAKEPDRRPESSGLTEVAVAKLKTLADHLTMDGITIESSLRDHKVGDSKFLTWKITLDVPTSDSFGGRESFLIRKRFIQVESDRISARMKEPTALHTYKTPSPEVDFSKPKATVSTVASDLASVVNDFNRVHTELLRSSNSRPLTEDELVASLWWQYGQSKLREEIRETVKEIVITRKLPPGWSIKLNSREWELPQQWWHEKPLNSSAFQINLIGKEGLATTIRNQFVSSDTTSLQPPESPLKTAILEFNESHSEEPDLTLDETLAALSTIWGKQIWYSSGELKPSTMDALMAAIDRQVMKGVQIELLRSYETGDDRFSVWSIRLVVQNDQDGSTQAFTIRERFQKVNSFSDETIHWGKPSDAGLQAGFRFKPAQTRYLAGQVVDVEFFYRTIHGKGLAATLPNAFHFNKIEIELLRADEKQRLSIEHDREKIIGGWRVEGIGEQPKHFKNRKIRFVDSAEKLATAQKISDDWTTNVMLPINTKCDIAFDVPDFADDSKNSGSLLTGGTQISILSAGDEKRQSANPLDSKTIPTLSYESFLQTELDSVKLKYNQGVASKDELLKAEMKLVEAKIRTAEAESVASLPALLKEREGILQKAFLAAKNNYESGLIGIDEFSQVVTELVDARFASRIATEGISGSLDSVSPNDVSIMLIEEFFVKQKTLGGDHPELLQLRDNVLKLRFDHTFDEVGIQKRLFELNRERQQLLKTRSEGHPSLGENLLRQQAVTSLRSGSFPKMLKMLVETDPRRANLLPQEWKGKWLVESATNGDGSLLDVAKGSKLSISNSTLDWQWGEIACEYYLVNGVTVNGQQSLVNLHWRSESPSMQGGAAIGDIQWVVEFRDNKLWIVRLDQPESPVSDSVDIIRPGHTRFVLTRTDEQVRTSDTELKQPREENVFKSLEILSRSENIPVERFRVEANKIAKQIENELGREGLWRAVELVVSVDVRERKTNGLVRVDGDPHQPLIKLDGELSELLDSTLPLQLRELGIELAQPSGPKWIQVGYSWNIQSHQSYWYYLEQLHESRQHLGIDEAFLQSAVFPNDFTSTTSAGLVAFLKETKGMPPILAFSWDLSISSVRESIKKNLGYDTVETLNDAFVKWIEEKYALQKLLTKTEDVRVRPDAHLNQGPFVDSEVTTGEASKVDSHSIETMKLRNEVEQLKKKVDRMNQTGEEHVTNVRRIPFPKEMQGVWRIKEAFSGVGEENGRIALEQYANQIVTISDSTMFLRSNIAGNHWYLSSLDAGTSPKQVELSVRPESVYKTFACLLEIQGDKLYLVRAQGPGFPRPKSVQGLGRGETLFVMSRLGVNPITPNEVIQISKDLHDENEDRTVRFKVESVHAPFVLGEPNGGHREGELHLDCRPEPHDFSLDQFLVVLTAEFQEKLRSEGVEDISKHFLGKTMTAKGPVRGVDYTARAMRGEHFHLIVDDPSKLIIDKSE